MKLKLGEELAIPLHLQQLERALNVGPYLAFVEAQLNEDGRSWPSDDEYPTDGKCRPEITDSEKIAGCRIVNGIKTSKDERRSDKMRNYNFECITLERQWLKNLLLSDTSSSDEDGDEITEQDIHIALGLHVFEQRYREHFFAKPENSQYMYYSSGVLSNFDHFPEHQKKIVGNKRKKKFKKDCKLKRTKKMKKETIEYGENQDQDIFDDMDFEEKLLNLKDEDDPDSTFDNSFSKSSKSKKRTQPKNPEVMAMRRRKIWAMMSKKELGKVQRANTNNHKEVVTSCKRVAQCCMKQWRQKAMQSQKNMKETLWRQKRLTREMQSYWKRYDRVERETRKRQEKEAEEQRKLDGELMEAKRQQRKLNFLITQTELYAHFMSKKLGGANHQEHLRILNQLEEEKNPRLVSMDSYDSEAMKCKVKKNVEDALRAEQSRTRQFAHGVIELGAEFKLTETSIVADEERPQPAIFIGNLKHYQLKGMNWLANLYDQGINGILADEMGLGKTVQSIAFLCHIAEKYDAWGPFLIISPASTLHNWQQEMARFVPAFKVVPYWGSPQERKILRQFWEQKDMHTREASFHVVITSYQLVITDFKYFNRIKWQYLILDEAQALKSTNSVRWKLLLGFSCRNRLLLSGTPIQNSMAELWALLHFIMPTLFDSHDEFNEWFSKDIESHAENKTGIDEKHLSRLHMILKPFMLRRIKKDVENELSDKIEIMVYCPLTMRQKLLYSALKKKIRIEDLLYSYSNNQSSQSVTSSLMNLVMQFRKVCNHPELFERREAKSPLYHHCEDYIIPRLIYENGFIDTAIPSKQHILINRCNIFAVEYIQHSLFPSSVHDDSAGGCFSFSRFCNFSPEELHQVAVEGLLSVFLLLESSRHTFSMLHHRRDWWDDEHDNPASLTILLQNLLHITHKSPLSYPHCGSSPTLADLIFTSTTCTFYEFTKVVHHFTPETMEHRIQRSRKYKGAQVMKVIPMLEEHLSETVADSKWPGGLPRPGNTSPSKILQAKLAPLSKALKTSSRDGTLQLSLPLSPSLKHPILPEFHHTPRHPKEFDCKATEIPSFLYTTCPRIQCRSPTMYCSSRAAGWSALRHSICGSIDEMQTLWYGSPQTAREHKNRHRTFFPVLVGGIEAATPKQGWYNIIVPDKQTLVTDAGKLYVLDGLLKKLKEQGHRVLIYSQMTKMIDLLEEYMWYRKHTCIRLDGSSKISERRDMVADFQSRDDIFVFLLSTRAGGLGINLTAADTVIFYDSDWNPTVDQQAMDRAHRLGQTKQVTVYRLICKGSIEERILQRAREKSEIQRMVISGGHFKPDTLKPKEVVSLLLDDEEIEKKYRQKQAEKRIQEVANIEVIREKDRDRKRKQNLGATIKQEHGCKRTRWEPDDVILESAPASPNLSEISHGSGVAPTDETSNEGLVVDDSPTVSQGFSSSFANNMLVTGRPRPTGRGGKRGRPRGSRRGGCNVRGRGMSLTVNMTNVDLGIGSPTVTAETPAQQPTRRGPGRPRLRPPGPSHQGTRGPSRSRRPARPLPVPLARSTPAVPSPEGLTFGFYTQKSSE